MSDEVETVFWENEAKHCELFQSKFGHRKHFEKWFSSYFEDRNKYFVPFEMTLSTFVPVLE